MQDPSPDDTYLWPKDRLVAALRDPATAGRRGVFVFALLLGSHDCSDLVPDLVACVLHGSFEEVDHALRILEAMDTEMSVDFMSETANRLRAALDAMDVSDWRHDAIDICLDMFESNLAP